jgi:hypothetical protein
MVTAVQIPLLPRRDVMVGVLPYFHIYGIVSYFRIICPPVNMSFRCCQAHILPLLLWLSRRRFAQI